MKDHGWIKLHRQVRDHYLFNEKREYSKLEAWIDLVMTAAYKETSVKFAGMSITIQRAQLIASITYFENRWSWKPKKVRNFLDILEKENMIKKITKSNKYTIFTIEKYEEYQGKEGQTEGPTKGQTKGQTEGQTESEENQQLEGNEGQTKGQTKGPTKGQTKGQQYKNIKNLKEFKEQKELKELKERDINISMSVKEIFDHYTKVFEGKFKRCSLTANRSKLISNRLIEGYTVAESLEAINNIKLDRWQMGEHKDNNVFKISLEKIFKDADSLEKWINYKPGPEIKDNKRVDNFNNYEGQRVYNFAELEKQFQEAQQQPEESNINNIMEEIKNRKRG